MASGSNRPDIVITGGGTAGHTNPGIAVGQALVEGGLDRDEILFVGGQRGNEGTLVPEAGFAIDLLPGRGIQRKLTAENIGSIAGLMGGLGRAFWLVLRRRPKAVLCLGGYAAFAVTAAAIALRVPVVVSEQNARASAVNRLFGRFARVCALPFPDTDLPKGVVTGNPARSTVLDAVAGADRTAARAALGARHGVDLDGRTVIAVWAGSLGATRINEAVRGLAVRWKDRDDIAVHHVVGRRDWSSFGAPPAEITDAAIVYRTVEYENDMPSVLVGSDVGVCRAGASTVTELAVAGLPAVLVPFPAATRDHQRANARELENAGGAVVVADAELDGDRLAELLGPIVDDRQARERMSEAATSVARPDAARKVADLLLEAGGIAGKTGALRTNGKPEALS